MSSVPRLSRQFAASPGTEIATVAGGCFWGVEHIFRKYFDGKGLLGASVGYANGSTENPTYREVCGSGTDHAEAVQILYDPEKLDYGKVVEFFLRIHDPTQLNHQGPDYGSQYRSAIFTNDDKQTEIARSTIKEVQQKYFQGADIVTAVEPLKSFWDAEEYHQKYLVNNPGGYECPTHYLRGGSQL